MSERRVQYNATVSVTLEIDVNDVWGDDCRVSQIEKQAIDSARGIVNQMASYPAPNRPRIRSMSCGPVTIRHKNG